MGGTATKEVEWPTFSGTYKYVPERSKSHDKSFSTTVNPASVPFKNYLVSGGRYEMKPNNGNKSLLVEDKITSMDNIWNNIIENLPTKNFKNLLITKLTITLNGHASAYNGWDVIVRFYVVQKNNKDILVGTSFNADDGLLTFAGVDGAVWNDFPATGKTYVLENIPYVADTVFRVMVGMAFGEYKNDGSGPAAIISVENIYDLKFKADYSYTTNCDPTFKFNSDRFCFNQLTDFCSVNLTKTNYANPNGICFKFIKENSTNSNFDEQKTIISYCNTATGLNDSVCACYDNNLVKDEKGRTWDVYNKFLVDSGVPTGLITRNCFHPPCIESAYRTYGTNIGLIPCQITSVSICVNNVDLNQSTLTESSVNQFCSITGGENLPIKEPETTEEGTEETTGKILGLQRNIFFILLGGGVLLVILIILIIIYKIRRSSDDLIDEDIVE
jgi:hypothetical protein